MVKILLGSLILFVSYFAFVYFSDIYKAAKAGKIDKKNFIAFGGIGFLANFFDTLGVGSFAIVTSIVRFLKLTDDRTLPGTLNVSCTIPTVLEAIIFLTVIKVDKITMISMIMAAVLGAVIGADIVAKFNIRKVRIGMGLALIVVAVMMLSGLLKLMPIGGTANGLTGIKLVIAIGCNFILGALMQLGVGLYAPCMALIYALGMNPLAAFPIMMGSCAFLMPAGSVQFVKKEAYDRKASIAITLFGCVGVLIAAYIVKSLPLQIVKWLVLVIVIYTSIMLLESASKARKQII
ncbi:sulfite exporter TauE/SafE family protein [Clostridium bowmanii]|uniref:sulfite exporter TauE/SafE family protein n=1 Tax=Clostridium bowmanii TaxID=132925 RepID=UPI001C0DEE13|nr:sulfite exporter TauE/SafE family protein [Clostridium bowmanii]MBU3191708.1 sulfite exporter TauE/SafE family protein [Clostridium bowmanii]MCA1076020.1 sulfite exporter TauE/SafE family protein [Clostridium bowmanii]